MSEKQNIKEALEKDAKKFFEDLEKENGAGFGFVNHLVSQQLQSSTKTSEESASASKPFEDAANATNVPKDFKDRIVIDKSQKAQINLKKEAELTRKAAKIVNDETVQNKVNELYEVIAKQLEQIKQEEEVYVKELLDGDSPHEEIVAYYAKNAHKYRLDEKGNYVIRDEYMIGAVGIQISSELLTKSRESKKQEAEKNGSKEDGR